MSIFDYTAKIKITFDRPIISDLSAVTGSEAYMVQITDGVTYLSSGDYSGYFARDVFDGSTSTFWRAAASSPPAWVGKDFGLPISLNKVSLYSGASYRPNGYTLQGSANGTDWSDVATGNFANATGWNNITFTDVSYRYWRVYITSYYTAGRVYIYEIQFWTTRILYSVPAGWSVAASEPNKQPGGSQVAVTYDIRKILKEDSDYSVVIYLKLSDRIKNPSGQVTVNFTGSMAGPGNAYVAPFSLPFTWLGTSFVFNPNAIEQISLDQISAVAGLIEIFKLYFKSADEQIELTNISATAAYYHIDDIPV